MEAEGKFQVATMRPEDSGRGLIRIPIRWMAAIKAAEGDVVQIQGKRKTAARAVGPYEEDEGLDLVRLDGLQRANAEIGAGDFVIVTKAESVPARRVVLAPAQKNLRLQGSAEALKRSFGMKPIVEGDIVATTGQQSIQRGDIPPELKQMLSAPSYALQEIRLTVVATQPKGIVHIDADTVVELKSEYQEGLIGSWSGEPLTLVDLMPAAAEAFNRSPAVSRFYTDRVDTEGGTDLIGISAEVNAFANLALSKKVSPPLSIGVFGEWGAGKSFFMESVHRAVRALAEEGGDEELHGDVVQIRFNAWHYIDTNLWASLVEFIFSELDLFLQRRNVDPQDAEALFGQLCTAQELKLEAAQELVRARSGLANAETALADARTAYRGALTRRAAAVLQAVLGDAEKKQLERAATILGYDSTVRASRQVVELFDDTVDVATRARLVRQSLLLRLGSGTGAALFLAAIVGVPFLVETVHAYLQQNSGAEWLSKIHSGVLAVAAAVGSVTAAAGVYVRQAVAAINHVEGIRDRLDSRLADTAPREGDPVKAAEREVRDLQQAIREAESRLERASAEAADAAQAYAGETARGRLNRFIKDKVAEGDYARHLGMVAAIRRDFGLLSDLMQQDSDGGAWDGPVAKLQEDQSVKVENLIKSAGEALTEAEKEDLQTRRPPPPPFFSRIVLYVDDLDRCPPDKVVEVLQAIHMLLYFPLFVVFVAVDVRWVDRALQSEFPMFLRGSNPAVQADEADPEGGTARGPAARAEHYLEKIFQIPFWVQRMAPAASSRFVAALAEGAVLAEDEAPLHEEAGTGPEEQAASPDIEAAPDVESVEAVAEPRSRRMQIAISRDELEDLEAFAAVVGTSPRRLKAYVNRYFLMRTAYFGGNREGIPASISCAAAALLAAVTGAPRASQGLLRTLSSPQFTSLASVAQEVAADEGSEEWRLQTFAAILQEREDEMGDLQPSLVESLRVMAELARRYSFLSD
ncbi:MAG TPA: P-loop NTPase fold protein [Allosphingosinicella sp.]|jgi:hypothetical protein